MGMNESESHLEQRVRELEQENEKLRRQQEETHAFQDFSHRICDQVLSIDTRGDIYSRIKEAIKGSSYDGLLFTKESDTSGLTLDHIRSADAPAGPEQKSSRIPDWKDSVYIDDSPVLQSVFYNSETRSYEVADFFYDILPTFSASHHVRKNGYEAESGIITPIEVNDTIIGALSLLRVTEPEMTERGFRRMGHTISTLFENVYYAKQTKELERELSEKKQELEAITEVLPLMYNVVDVNYRIVDASEHFVETFSEKTLDEIRGKKCYTIYKGRDEVCTDCTVSNVITTGDIAQRETTSSEIAKTGKRFNIYAVPLRDQQGSIENVMELILETTGFIETELRYKRLLENMDEVFWIQENGIERDKNTHRKILYVNPAFEELTGYSVERLYQDPSLFNTMLHPEDRTIPRLEDVSEGERKTHEFRIIRSDGTLRHVRSKIYREKEAENITRTYGLAHDITDIKEAEETINDAYRLNTRLIENAPIGIVTADTKGTVIMINEALLGMLGYTRDEAIQMSSADFHPPELSDEVNRSFQRMIRFGYDRHSFEMKHKEGHIVYADVSGIYDEASEQVTAYIVDISERMKAHKGFEKEQKILRHDLKNPISGIMHISRSLLEYEQEIDEAQVEYWKAVNMASTKAFSILENTILSNKISIGTQELQLQEFDVEELVQNLYDAEFKYVAEDKRITFSTRYDRLESDSSVKYVGDEHLFDRMLSNLLSNAFSSSSRDDAIAFEVTEKDDFLYMTLHNPKPLPEELRENYFEATGVSSKRYTGEGYGKEIIKNIVSMHAGTIDYESDESLGTKFYLVFPKKE